MASPAAVTGLVSVILPVRNRPDLLREAVASVQAQTYRPIEILIVDDASDDATPRVISELVRSSEGVRALRHPRCRGPGASRETGRACATGEFIQYLDSDDLLATDKLARQVAALLRHPACGLVYGDVQERLARADGQVVTRTRSLPRLERAFPRMLVERIWHTFVPLYRRTLVDAVGPWLDLWQEEDWEYDTRIAATATPIHKLDGVVGTMRRFPTGQLSGGAPSRRMLAARATARPRMLANALRGGVPRDSGEMQHFVRALFLLSRQCGAVGLVAESKSLFALARANAERPRALDYRGYAAAASVLGWRGAGVLARTFDHVRARCGA